MENADNGGIVWSDRKRIAFGLPWTFTKYTLTKEKLLIHTGMLNTQEDEVRLYRIMDVTLRRSLWERMFGLGTIHCCSADKSTPEFDIAWVKDAAQVKETLSDMVEAERMAKRVSSREFMTDDEDGEMLKRAVPQKYHSGAAGREDRPAALLFFRTNISVFPEKVLLTFRFIKV